MIPLLKSYESNCRFSGYEKLGTSSKLSFEPIRSLETGWHINIHDIPMIFQNNSMEFNIVKIEKLVQKKNYWIGPARASVESQSWNLILISNLFQFSRRFWSPKKSAESYIL